MEKIRSWWIVVALIVAVLMTPLFAQQREEPKVTGVLATLKVGHAVNVKESGERYLLTVIDGQPKLPQSHTVVEVGSDWVVVKDQAAGLTETRIPIWSIKAVVVFRGLEPK